jgi:hypothetical protein
VIIFDGRVASDLPDVSAHDMLAALIDGAVDPAVIAQFARRRMCQGYSCYTSFTN